MKVHNQQRYDVHTNPNRGVEFVGSMGNADVFWLTNPTRALVKFGDAAGDSYWCSVAHGEPLSWTRGHNVRASLPQEQRDLAIVMCRCFAQTDRPPEWDEVVPSK
jgi:hypothetical protein